MKFEPIDCHEMSAEEIVAKSKETYGKAMCMDCVFALSEEAEEEIEKAEEENMNLELEFDNDTNN